MNLLKYNYPELFTQIDTEKTKNVDINKLTIGTKKRVWWKCCNAHSFESRVDNRVKSPNCSECFLEENNFKKKYPELLKYWNYDDNVIEPSELTCATSQKIHWICENNHKFEKNLIDFIRSQKCPSCPIKNLQKDRFKKDYIPQKILPLVNWKLNGINTEEKILYSRRIEMLCGQKHKFHTQIYKIINGSYMCPKCYIINNNITITNPELLKIWNYEKNQINPSQITKGMEKKVWWICENGHEYEAKVNSRTNLRKDKNGCPYCSGKLVDVSNCLANKFPLLSKEWHKCKNGDLTPFDVTPGTNKKVWWICSLGHEWETAVSARTIKKAGCLYCCGLLIDENMSLSKLFPEVSAEWNFNKNDINPSRVSPYSHKRVWWICKKGHEWEVQIYNRTCGSSCPYCSKGSFSKVAIKWLEEIEIKNNLKIKHAMNGGEHKIKLYSGQIIKVDGYCEEKNTIYEFYGCYYHAHPPNICKFKHNRQPCEINKLNGKLYAELYQNTIDRENMLKKMGYNLEIIWECDFRRILCHFLPSYRDAGLVS